MIVDASPVSHHDIRFDTPRPHETRTMFAYSVICQFVGTDPAGTSRRWLDWLIDQHLADVLAAGAASADVVRWDGEPLTLEVRYTFASRAAFNQYEQDHAPRLRSEGITKFPPGELGLSYRRQTGEIVACRPTV